jgi:hypothetical protein
MTTQYLNLSMFTSELRTSTGRTVKVGPKESAEATKSDPFVKQRFPGFSNRWSKI